MKKYKKVLQESTQVMETKCDLCGATTPGNHWFGDSRFETAEVTVKLREEHDYHKCGLGTEYSVDLCNVCFKEKLLTWLKSQGILVTETTWDW